LAADKLGMMEVAAAPDRRIFLNRQAKVNPLQYVVGRMEG
jgi:hypothetical protein